jgi:phosphotriesterase-related protein
MNTSTRRKFLKKAVLLGSLPSFLPELSLGSIIKNRDSDYLMTVNGKVRSSEIGFTLTHEHILVDFTGADNYDPDQWNDDEVLRVVKPYIQEIKELGCRTMIECTPNFIGRDPILLRKISDQTGLNMITNTGFYGAADNKYLPRQAFTEPAETLARMWIKESKDGIEGTGIRPGFMKIGVAPGSLSELHQKLVKAAAITHLETGLSIASHTGPAKPAFEQIDLLRSAGISPEAFIWVHAQNEENSSNRIKVAKAGAWVSIDGLNTENVHQYVRWLQEFRNEDLLNKILVSHDAGWYSPGEPGGGSFTPYSTVFEKLLPELRKYDFTDQEIGRIFINNPAAAFSIRLRKA